MRISTNNNPNSERAEMNGIQLKAAFAISEISLVIFSLHQIWPTKILLNQATLVLLVIATLPWLTLFFKKFKIPGIGEAETRERIQGTTQKPIPPSPGAQVVTTTRKISPNTKKVLATLYRYQRQSFGNDNTKRWTFMIYPNASEFPRYLAGVSEAVNLGWVTVSPETHQYMLTNEGLAYIEKNQELQEYGDIYRF
jgi:hypothetical protein